MSKQSGSHHQGSDPNPYAQHPSTPHVFEGQPRGNQDHRSSTPGARDPSLQHHFVDQPSPIPQQPIFESSPVRSHHAGRMVVVQPGHEGFSHYYPHCFWNGSTDGRSTRTEARDPDQLLQGLQKVNEVRDDHRKTVFFERLQKGGQSASEEFFALQKDLTQGDERIKQQRARLEKDHKMKLEAYRLYGLQLEEDEKAYKAQVKHYDTAQSVLNHVRDSTYGDAAHIVFPSTHERPSTLSKAVAKAAFMRLKDPATGIVDVVPIDVARALHISETQLSGEEEHQVLCAMADPDVQWNQNKFLQTFVANELNGLVGPRFLKTIPCGNRVSKANRTFLLHMCLCDVTGMYADQLAQWKQQGLVYKLAQNNTSNFMVHPSATAALPPESPSYGGIPRTPRLADHEKPPLTPCITEANNGNGLLSTGVTPFDFKEPPLAMASSTWSFMSSVSLKPAAVQDKPSKLFDPINGKNSSQGSKRKRTISPGKDDGPRPKIGAPEYDFSDPFTVEVAPENNFSLAPVEQNQVSDAARALLNPKRAARLAAKNNQGGRGI